MPSNYEDLRRVQAEFLLPHELEAAVIACPVAYLPLGSLEYHSVHLPIGLDALNAHGVCTRAAARAGGIVLPPLYQGTGGGHATYRWTIMMNSRLEIGSHLIQTLQRLQEFGLQVAVLYTGHFADEQLSMIDDIAREWNGSAENAMQVLALGVSRCDVSPIAPDHAGVFETSLLFALWPDRVQEEQLPRLSDFPSTDPGGNTSGGHRHDPTHPLWGIFGPDPRDFDRKQASHLLEVLVNWLVTTTNAHLRP
jgi:creatinine amidohydrolase